MKHKHAEVIKAYADGDTVQWKNPQGNWADITCPSFYPHSDYRIKPEPRPDIVQTVFMEHGSYMFRSPKDNVKITFDGETGKLKSVELIQ